MQGTISSGTAGLRVDTGTFKVVYFAFGFEAIDSAGDRSTVMRQVLDWLLDPLVAAYSASTTSGVVPLSVSFFNQSTGDYGTCEWIFGDGGTSDDCNNPTHTYTTAGSYTVTLTVSGQSGTDTLSRTNYITAYTPVQAGFSAAPTSGVAPLEVSFTNLASGDYTDSLWHFGDGLTSTQDSPNHTYATSDIYDITLTVSGPGGTDTLIRTDYIAVYEPVAAAFTATPTSGAAPLEVIFTNASTGDYTDSLWTFGDGATSTQAHPSHTYSTAGVYTVSLTVSGAGGSNTETKANLVSVSRRYYFYLPLVSRDKFVP